MARPSESCQLFQGRCRFLHRTGCPYGFVGSLHQRIRNSMWAQGSAAGWPSPHGRSVARREASRNNPLSGPAGIGVPTIGNLIPPMPAADVNPGNHHIGNWTFREKASAFQFSSLTPKIGVRCRAAYIHHHPQWQPSQCADICHKRKDLRGAPPRAREEAFWAIRPYVVRNHASSTHTAAALLGNLRVIVMPHARVRVHAHAELTGAHDWAQVRFLDFPRLLACVRAAPTTTAKRDQGLA